MRKIFCFFILAATLSFSLSAFAEGQSAYDRVIATRTLKCGYNSYEPVIWRDAKTNEMKGIFPEYMEALGKATGLKIEWTEEVGWGDMPAALQARKIDAMCAGAWATPKTGLLSSYTKPILFNSIEAYVRPDDHRFDKDLMKIDDPSVMIATIDGGETADIAEKVFPHAKTLALPSLGTDAEQLMNVASGKADVTFTNAGTVASFLQKNPGKIRQVATDTPLRIYGVTAVVDIHEQALLSLLNVATTELIDSGVIDRIMDKYEKDFPGAFVRAPKSYK